MRGASGARSVKVLWRASTTEKVVALTFDDGPGTDLTGPLLDVLRDHKVRATFCLVGQRAFEHRDLVRRQMRDGHELANHTWTHPDLSLLDYGALSHELERTDQLLSELSGHRPAVIRPPYGRVNAALLQHAALAHQGVVLWDVHFQDAVLDSAGNAAHVLERIAPGSIVLGHDAGRRDRSAGIAAVPEVIRKGRAQDYEFVTASELLELDATFDPASAIAGDEAIAELSRLVPSRGPTVPGPLPEPTSPGA